MQQPCAGVWGLAHQVCVGAVSSGVKLVEVRIEHRGVRLIACLAFCFAWWFTAGLIVRDGYFAHVMAAGMPQLRCDPQCVPKCWTIAAYTQPRTVVAAFKDTTRDCWLAERLLLLGCGT